jgi:hypothetical protein
MARNIIINLLLSLLVINLGSCNSVGEYHISSAEEIKNQTDTVELKQVISSYSEGKRLFGRFCNTCHVAPERNVADQYLFDNLFDRLPSPSEDYFVSYISDSKELKASGNKYAQQVDTMWNNAFEHKFKDSLSKRDFSNLISYIKIAAKQRYQK